MLIFLDSSIFCSDFHLTSTNFELLKSYINKGGSWLCLSEIVIDEVKNKYKEKITAQLQKVNSEICELNKSTLTDIPLVAEELIKKEFDDYEKFWDMLPYEYGNSSSEEYPKNPHKEIVQRALERKKPFKEDGKDGYRDYLIWLTFLDVVSHYTMENACFVTLNTRDFSDSIKKNELHPQLKKDIEEKGICLSNILYFASLKDFIEQQVKPGLQVITEHEKLIKDLKADLSGFMEPYNKALTKELQGLDLTGYDVFVMDEGKNPSIDNIDEVSETDIEDISEVSESELLLTIRSQALCNIGFYILKSDYLVMKDTSQFSVVDSDWNKHYIWAEAPMELAISLEVVYDKNKKHIKSMDIEGLEDAFADCPYCPY